MNNNSKKAGDSQSTPQQPDNAVNDVKEVKEQKEECPPVKVHNIRGREFVADPIRWNNKIGFICYSRVTGQVIRGHMPITYNGIAYVCGLPNLPGNLLILPDGLGKPHDPEILFGRIVELLREVFVPPSEGHLIVIAIHIFASWNFDRHDDISYVFFVGLPESGKTAGLKACAQLSFSTFWASGSSSLAAVVRMLNGVRGTLALDEAQRDRAENNPTSDYHRLLVEGNQREGVVVKCKETKSGFEAEPLFVFGPKYQAGRSMSTDEAVTSRAVEIRLPRLPAIDVKEISNRNWQEKARILRNDLLLYRQQRAIGEMEAPGNQFAGLLNKAEFNPREIQVFRWLLMECPSEVVAHKIVEFLRSRKSEVRDARSHSFEHQVLLATFHTAGSQFQIVANNRLEATGKVLLKDIAERLGQWGHGKYSSKAIASVLRHCGVEIGHGRDGDYVKTGKVQLAGIFVRLGYPDPSTSPSSPPSSGTDQGGSNG